MTKETSMTPQRLRSKHHTRTLISSLLLGVGALSWSLAAGAQSPSTTLSTCINKPVEVPGLSGAPNWFTSNPATFDDPTGSRLDIDEPRWAGAALMPFEGVLSAGSPM